MTGDLGVDLRTFLSNQYGEGQVDSEGSFTIASEKALQKLAFFALPHQFDWVLKIVQAVNLWKADSLVVAQSRTATSFTFSPSPQPSPGSLLNALSSTAMNTSDPVHALAMALRSLVEQVGLSFVLAFRNQGVSGRPIYAGDDTTHLSPRVRELWSRLELDGIRLTVSHFRGSESFTGRYTPTLAKVPKRHEQILKTLRWNAVPSGVPIYLDGERLNDPAQVPLMGYSPGFRPLRRAELRVSEQEPGTLRFVGEDYSWAAPARQLYSAGAHDSAAPWFILRTADWKELHNFVLFDPITPRSFPLYKTPPHRVLLTRQGVVCASYIVPNGSYGSSLVLVAPADHYRSDLSGLGLEINERENEGLINLRRHVVDALAEYRGEFISILDTAPQLHPKPPTDPSLQGKRAGHSIFTESLGRTRARLSQYTDELRDRLWHHQLSQARRRVLLRRWHDYVLEDLERVILDLDRRPMQLDR